MRVRIRTENLGAAAGPHDWGEIRPGLARVLGRNGAGKSTLLAALAALGGRLRDLHLPIRWGANVGRLEVGEAVYTATSGGEVTAEHAERLPEIAEVPDDLVSLVQPGLKGDDATARRRLAALLAFRGVGLDDAAVGDLLLSVTAPEMWREDGEEGEPSPLTEPLRDHQRDAWARLAEPVGKATHALEPGWLHLAMEMMGAPARDLIGLADWLRDKRLLPWRLTAEKALVRLDKEIAAAVERCRGLGADPVPGTIQHEALMTVDVEAARLRLQSARHAAREKAAKRDAELTLAERARQRLEELGPRPEPIESDPAKAEAVDRLAEELDLAERARDEAAKTQAAHEAAIEGARRRDAEGAAEWGRFVSEVNDEGPSQSRAVRAEETLSSWSMSRAAIEGAVAEERELHDAHQRAARAAERAGLAWHEADRALADELGRIAERAREIERWEQVHAEWTRPAGPCPTAEEVEAAAAIAAAAELDAAEAEKAGPYRAAYDVLRALRRDREWLDSVRAACERAAADAWMALGAAATKRLGIPWLRLAGLRIELRLEAGRLVEEGGTWRDIDASQDGASLVSTGELQASLVRLLIADLKPGQIVLMPWSGNRGHILAAVQPSRLDEIHEEIAATGAAVAAEWPDDGEPRIEMQG